MTIATEDVRPATGATPSGRRHFLIGVAAMAGAMAFTYAGGIVLGAVPYPPGRVVDVIRTVIPGGLATATIETFQHWGLRALFIAVHAGLLLLAGYGARRLASIPAPGRRARVAAVVAAGLFGVSLVLAVTAGGGMAWPALLVYGVASYGYARISAGVSLGRILEPEVREGETPLDAMRRSRRSFLGRGIALGGVALLLGVGISKLLRRAPKVRIVGAARPFAPPPPDATFPQVAGLSPEITPTDEFYNVDIDFLKPSVDAATWRLTVEGLVTSPYVLSFTQLQNSFEVVEMAHTLTCISNEVGGDLISTAVWRGVRLKDVLAKAGLGPSVSEIVFKSTEGYSDSIPMAKAMEDTTLVVFGMNGEPLPIEHGFPARIIVPGIYGMKNVKWLTDITAVDHHYRGYWEVRGWDEVARVKTESRIDVPTSAATVHLPAKLAGVAWAGDRGIIKVEVSDDGGATWRPAVLKRELSPVAWRLWATDISPGTGPRRVLVRATDGTGEVQTSEPADPHPSGASGWDFVTFQVA
ncbi:MAG: molybdopterin-dependent oxidoreductase [Candidatus Dormibacteria bacterium]